ncbi:hypothetical protein KSP39_PZI003763 [Platanthera zijinensis]|uniref:Uncharacterized protein n=1 Tax=Platanthera zijinensis TaxID=2320716 RepID=A0AAP0BWU9_9ASPA
MGFMDRDTTILRPRSAILRAIQRIPIQGTFQIGFKVPDRRNVRSYDPDRDPDNVGAIRNQVLSANDSSLDGGWPEKIAPYGYSHNFSSLASAL